MKWIKGTGWALLTYSAEIIRDEFGVPHIYGKRDADVAFGVAVAHAEDDFFTLQDVIAMAKGRYGAIAGQDGAAVDYVYHLLDARGVAERNYPDLPADTRALFEAYAAGLNQYAKEHPEELKLANLFPVSGVDVAAGFTLCQPFFFGLNNVIQPVAWYEFSVESEEGWHFTGANFPGSPFPFLGHNRHLGWTNTVNRPDMVDVYQLEMDEAGTSYKLDDQWIALEEKDVILPVKFGPITIPYPETVYRSVHGPVIKNDKGVFAIRYASMDSIDQLDAYYRINKATNLTEWQEQMARMDIPSTNFIYADEAGNIAYVYNAAMPDRPEGHDWRNILPGNRSDLIWDRSVDYAAIPKLINPAAGWVYNANNTPFSATDPASDLDPAEYAPEMGVELKVTNRSRRAAKLGAATPVMDRSALERIKFDMTYEREGYVADLWDALEALDPADDEELAGARDLLLQWDFTADNKGPADALALLMIRDFMSAEYNNKIEKPDVAEHLRKHMDHLNTHFGRIDPPMSDLLRLRHGTSSPFAVDLPLDGGSDTLRASTTWAMDDDGRLRLVHGDSFIQWVEWEQGQRVRSQSIQPFGSAITRPGSPHFTDQAQLFVDHKLKPVHFWREDVLRNAKSRYVVESY